MNSAIAAKIFIRDRNGAANRVSGYKHDRKYDRRNSKRLFVDADETVSRSHLLHGLGLDVDIDPHEKNLDDTQYETNAKHGRAKTDNDVHDLVRPTVNSAIENLPDPMLKVVGHSVG